MADGREKKGTVTPLSSLFPPEEAEKAARRVEEAITDRRKEVGRLRGFLADNYALIHHVQKLPDELSHDVMVPFGGAAFFPGHLIHTNEFLVFLGDGYYAEKSAKQTVEVLQRRGKSLEAQLELLKKVVSDLEMEAKFFDSTATEAAEGIVQIREEYVEEVENQRLETDFPSMRDMGSSEKQNSGISDEKEEHAKLMARLEELEKEEEEAGSDLAEDEDDETAGTSDEDNEDEDGEDEDDDTEYVNDKAKNYQEVYKIPVPKARCPEKAQSTSVQHNIPVPKARCPEKVQSTSVQHNIPSSKVEVFPTGSLESNLQQLDMTQAPSKAFKVNEHLPKTSNIQASSESSPSKSSKMSGTTERKAFTGSVIEHSHGLSPVQSTNIGTSGQTSRPISRFKLQKGDR